MSEKIRAIKIDVEKREVYEIGIEPGEDAICEALYQAIDCRTFTSVFVKREETLWVDDEALELNPQPDKFIFKGYDTPLAGNGVICGNDDQGRAISSLLEVEEVRERVFWCGSRYVEPQCGFIPYEDLPAEMKRMFFGQ